MKYIVMLADGAADEPIESLGGKTPLEAAKTPVLDWYSERGEIGMVATIPEGMAPGSDTANLSVIGYNPRNYYTGRSPLEALSIGVPMKDTDIALRANIVTLSEEESEYEDRTIIDHSSDEISTKDAAVLLKACSDVLSDDEHSFYTGTSYRHCLIRANGKVMELIPPHDVLGQKIGPYLPVDEKLRDMMKKSYDILVNHPLNIERKKAGLNPGNSLWFWGAGTKPALTSFEERYHKKGLMISAVDLLKGIAVGIGMDTVNIEGANGGLNTNYEGKADAAVDGLLNKGYDLAYIHLEAPDEMGHQGSAERKVKSIENMDSRMLARIKEKMEGTDYRIIVLPDHPTPVRLRTHVAYPVPYMIYDSTNEQQRSWHYNEREAAKSGCKINRGWEMMDYLLSR